MTEEQKLLKELKEENRRLAKEAEGFRQQAGTLQQKVERLEEQLTYLLKKLYTPRTERFENPNQQDLFDSLLELAKTEKKAEGPRDFQRVEYTRVRPKKRGPKPIPEQLPRKVIPLDPPEESCVCACCSKDMERVDEVVTEELDVIPPRFVVNQYVRGKYRCRSCMNRDIVEPLPPRPINNGRPSPGLLAFLIVSKYCDHIPLYRIEQIFKRYGIELSRTTIDSWFGPTTAVLRPIVEALKRELLSERFLQVDETTIRALDKALPGRTRRCYIWAYCRPYGEVVYDFTVSRSSRWPQKFLDGFSGHLQCDGYSGYAPLWSEHIRHIACMAHIRRKIFEAQRSAPEETSAILKMIGLLSKLEKEAQLRRIVGDDLVALRREHARPLLDEIKTKVDELAPRALPKSKLGKAVDYAQSQWEAMLRYVEVPEARLDNNSCEQVIKPVVIGRKNFLFVGSTKGGGERAEVFYSLVQSCNRLDIDPYGYLRDVLERLPAGDYTDIHELTPRAWKVAQERAEKTSSRSAL